MKLFQFQGEMYEKSDKMSDQPLYTLNSPEISTDLYITPQPLYNTIVGVQANFRVSYPIRVITRVKCIDI